MSENTVTFDPGGKACSRRRGLTQKESLWLNCNWNCEKTDDGCERAGCGGVFFIFLSLTLIPYLGYQNECNFQLYTNVTHLI